MVEIDRGLECELGRSATLPVLEDILHPPDPYDSDAERLSVGLTRDGEWVLLRRAISSRDFRQLRLCDGNHSAALGVAHAAGNIVLRDEGPGCRLAVWA